MGRVTSETGRLLSPSADVAVRLAIGVLGLASFFGVFQLLESDSGLGPVARVALAIPLGGAFVVAVSVVSELKGRYEGRVTLRFRRWGRRPIVVSNVEGASAVHYPHPQVYSTAPTERFSIRLASTLVTLALGVLMAGVSWIGAIDAASGDGLIETGMLLVCALTVGLWLSVRSVIRLALRNRAVELDSSALTLGIALGFAWPVRLPLGEIEEVVIFDAARGAEAIIRTRTDRSFRIDGRRLKDEAGFVAWWAENTAPGLSFEREVEPVPRIEVEPPMIVSGAGTPDPQRVEALQAAMRRRTVAAISCLSLAVLLTAGAADAYIDLRLENDQLVQSGNRYIAEVIDVDRSRRGPDAITIGFVANGTAYERTITSAWFMGYRHDLEGENVTVLFDASREGMARLPGSRNYPALLRFSLFGAPFVLMLATMSYRNHRWQTKALRRGPWTRARVRIGDTKPRMAHIRRNGDAETHRAHIFFHNMNGYGGGEAWVSGYNRGLVVIFDDADHWLPALLGKKSPLRQPVKA